MVSSNSEIRRRQRKWSLDRHTFEAVHRFEVTKSEEEEE